MKMTDQCAGHEIAGRENDGPTLQGIKLQNLKLHDVKSQDKKYSVNRDYITLQRSVHFFAVVIFLETHILMHCV